MSENRIHIPEALDTKGAVDDAAAILREYYGNRYTMKGTEPFTGAWFDHFDPSGTRASTPNEITADDLLSLSLLSTPVRGSAAVQILGPLKERITALLSQIPVNEKLSSHSKDVEPKDFPAWRLENLLREIDGIGLTYASKIIARKRPHLYPIMDSVVLNEIGTKNRHLNPIRTAFQDQGLLDRIHAARIAADLPESISDLRIFDVITWMQGKKKGRVDPAELDAPGESEN